MEPLVTGMRRSARKPKGDGHLRRAEILAAAERIFVIDGYGGATIRRIADEVGVSSTALYMHFPDKGAILLEICEQSIAELLERNAVLAGLPLDPGERVRQMLESYMRWGLRHPNAYQLVFSGSNPVSVVQGGEVAEMASRCYAIFSGVVQEIGLQHRLRAADAETTAQTLWAACHGVVMLRITRPGFAWSDVNLQIGTVLDGLMLGLVRD